MSYNLAAITASLVASKATCCAGQSLSVTLQGNRVVELLVSSVEPFDHTYVCEKTVLSLRPDLHHTVDTTCDRGNHYTCMMSATEH